MFRIKVPTLIASGVLAVVALLAPLVGSGVANANPGYDPRYPDYGYQQHDVSVGINVMWQNNNGGHHWQQWPGNGCGNGCNNGQFNRDWIAEWWTFNRGNPPWPCRVVHTNYGPVRVQDFQHWRQIGYEDYGNGNMRFYYV